MTNRATCPGCMSRDAVQRELPEYRYLACGLSNVRLVGGGVLETSCKRCRETYVRVLKEWQLLQVIALRLFMTPKRLTGPELKLLRNSCLMSQAEFARLTRHRRETVAEREARQDPKLTVAEEAWLRLVLLEAFRRHLDEPGNNHLTAVHRRRLDAFARSFCRWATGLAEKVDRPEVIRFELGRDWKLGDAA